MDVLECMFCIRSGLHGEPAHQSEVHAGPPLVLTLKQLVSPIWFLPF